jgi:hypothetical protein
VPLHTLELGAQDVSGATIAEAAKVLLQKLSFVIERRVQFGLQLWLVKRRARKLDATRRHAHRRGVLENIWHARKEMRRPARLENQLRRQDEQRRLRQDVGVKLCVASHRDNFALRRRHALVELRARQRPQTRKIAIVQVEINLDALFSTLKVRSWVNVFGRAIHGCVAKDFSRRVHRARVFFYLSVSSIYCSRSVMLLLISDVSVDAARTAYIKTHSPSVNDSRASALTIIIIIPRP